MRCGKFMLALGLAGSLIASGKAQPPGGDPRIGFAGGMAGRLVSDKQLQDELKVDREQVDKLQSALAKARDDLKDDMARLREASPNEREKIFAKMHEVNDKAVSSVLKPEQVKRLHQIENQAMGTYLFEREDIQKDLKLSDEQKDKINGIRDETQKEMRDAFRGGPGGFDPTEANKKISAIRKDAMDKVRKVLSDDQKSKVKDLLGDHFEMAFPALGGGFGRPGTGGFFPGAFAPPGQILSAGTQNQLKLTDEQKKQLEELQKDVDSKLGKILTEEQRKQLKEMQQGPPRGPGGRAPGDRPAEDR